MRSAHAISVFALVLLACNLLYAGPQYVLALSWLNNSEHRLPNVRPLADECRAPFIRKFISLQDWSKPKLVVFGDSQAFAMNVPAAHAWPNLFSKKSGLDLDVINLAVIDGRPLDTEFIASQLPPKTAELAIFNLNQSHFTLPDYRYVQPVERAPLEFVRCVFSLRRYLADVRLGLPGDGAVRETYHHIPLQADRYEMPEHKELTERSILAVSKAARKSIVYVTPNNVDAFPEYQFGVEAYKAGSARLLDECRSVGTAICMDFSSAFSIANYYDIVHFNTVGNTAFADLLAKGFKDQSM